MAKKKDASAEAEPTEAPAEKMTQREAVEKALAAGKDLPAEGVPYVLKEFGITLSNQAFSTIKSKINTAGKTSKAKPEGGVNPVGIKPRTGGINDGNTKAADLARAVKQLIESYGATEVQGMVKVFAE